MKIAHMSSLTPAQVLLSTIMMHEGNNTVAYATLVNFFQAINLPIPQPPNLTQVSTSGTTLTTLRTLSTPANFFTTNGQAIAWRGSFIFNQNSTDALSIYFYVNGVAQAFMTLTPYNLQSGTFTVEVYRVSATQCYFICDISAGAQSTTKVVELTEDMTDIFTIDFKAQNNVAFSPSTVTVYSTQEFI